MAKVIEMNNWRIVFSPEWVQIKKAVRFAVDAQTYDNPELKELSNEILRNLDPVPLPAFMLEGAK